MTNIQQDAAKAGATETPIGKTMTAAGYTATPTGGGCMAWEKKAPEGHFVWICDGNNGLGDDFDEEYLVALYTPQGECTDDDAKDVHNLSTALIEAETMLDGAEWLYTPLPQTALDTFIMLGQAEANAAAAIAQRIADKADSETNEAELDDDAAQAKSDERVAALLEQDYAKIDALPVSDTLKSVLKRALMFHANQFDGDPDTDLDVSGADTVDWWADLRGDLRNAITPAPTLNG